MTYSVEYDPAEKIIIVKLSGKTNLADFSETIEKIVCLAEQENCFRVLSDLREINLEATTMQIYSFPDTVSQVISGKGFKTYSFKRAFVAPNGNNLLEFYETVSYNRNHRTRLFHDLADAKKWLQES